MRKFWQTITGQRKKMLAKARAKMRVRHTYHWEDELNVVISLSKDPELVVSAVIEVGRVRLARAFQQRIAHG
jgi:hypothetical protein